MSHTLPERAAHVFESVAARIQRRRVIGFAGVRQAEHFWGSLFDAMGVK